MNVPSDVTTRWTTLVHGRQPCEPDQALSTARRLVASWAAKTLPHALSDRESTGHRPASVVLVRHGATDWSTAGRHTGRTDVLLDPTASARRGRSPRRWPRCAPRGAITVLCSPLVRAARTAELAGLVPYDLDDDLVEWDYGAYEGLTTPQIREQVPGWTVFTHPAPAARRPRTSRRAATASLARVAQRSDPAVTVVWSRTATCSARWRRAGWAGRSRDGALLRARHGGDVRPGSRARRPYAPALEHRQPHRASRCRRREDPLWAPIRAIRRRRGRRAVRDDPRARRLRASLDEVQSTAEDFRVALFGPEPKLFGHVVEPRRETLGGFAVWYVNFSTWSGKHGIYLEDLYVRPHLRGHGLRQGAAGRRWPASAWSAATPAWSGGCWTGTSRRSSFYRLDRRAVAWTSGRSTA